MNVSNLEADGDSMNKLFLVSFKFSLSFLLSFSATTSAALPRGHLITGTVPKKQDKSCKFVLEYKGALIIRILTGNDILKHRYDMKHSKVLHINYRCIRYKL